MDTFSNSIIDADDCDSQGDDDDDYHIRQQVVRNQHRKPAVSELQQFLMTNNLSEFIPML